jgi:hypothetical protein
MAVAWLPKYTSNRSKFHLSRSQASIKKRFGIVLLWLVVQPVARVAKPLFAIRFFDFGSTALGSARLLPGSEIEIPKSAQSPGRAVAKSNDLFKE